MQKMKNVRKGNYANRTGKKRPLAIINNLQGLQHKQALIVS